MGFGLGERGLFLAIAIALASFGVGVSGLKCWHCADYGDGNCQIGFGKVEECTLPDNVCVNAHGQRADGRTAIIRACGKGSLVGCHADADLDVRGEKVKGELCSCKEDLCNGSTGQRFSVMSVTLAAVLALFVTRQLNADI